MHHTFITPDLDETTLHSTKINNRPDSKTVDKKISTKQQYSKAEPQVNIQFLLWDLLSVLSYALLT